MQLEANIHSNRPSKKLDQKKYRSFRISKNIGQGEFQLELLERWIIHNVFNEDLLTQYKELQFKEQICTDYYYFVYIPLYLKIRLQT